MARLNAATPPDSDELAAVIARFTPGARPRYQHLTSLLETAISTQGLQPGSQLPPERTMARRLGVSRTTVVNAYRELEARGLVRGHVGRGTFVCAAPEPTSAPFAWRGKVASSAQRTADPLIRDLIRLAVDPAVVSLAAGVPALDIFPTRALADACVRALERNAVVALSHGPTEGIRAFREAVARFVGTQPERVLAVSGAQQGLDLVARCLLDTGDVVIMDRPGYLGAIQAFRAAGAHIVGWDVQREDLDELEDLVTRYRPKLLYTNPTFQNPTGHLMSLPTRRDLLLLANRYRLPIVEDDTYRRLYFATPPPPSLATLDEHDLVIHVDTCSKMLAPGLRLGWLIASPAIVEHIALIKQRADPHTQNLVQLAIADLMSDGTLDRHLGRLRAEHARRCDAMLRSLAKDMPSGLLRAARPEGGLYLWAQLRRGVTARALLQDARQAGVAFVAGEVFYPDAAGAGQLRLCFSSLPPERGAEGVSRLAACARRLASPRHAVGSVPIV
jgi:DNA-binding transcriptional MocR family regulator